MNLTRKQFLSLSSKATAAAALGSSLFSPGTSEAADATRNSAAVQKFTSTLGMRKKSTLPTCRRTCGSLR